MNKDKPGPDRAIALRYDPQQEEAPRVVAKGSGIIAENIRRLAETMIYRFMRINS